MTDTGKIIGLIEALGGGGGGSGGGVSATVIADAFSTSKAYSAGEYVTKSDKLYVFTADHAAGAWIGTDADEVTVGEELSDVKSAIDALKKYAAIKSPADLQAIAASGKAKEYFDIGDVIEIPWTNYTPSTPVMYKLPFVVADIADCYDDQGALHKDAIWLMCQYAEPEKIPFDAAEDIVVNLSTEPKALEGWFYWGLTGADTYTALNLSAGDDIPTTYDSVHKCAINQLNTLRYGYNRWSQSAYRQWLNSAAAKNANWWTSQHTGDVAPTATYTNKPGWLFGFEKQWLDIIKPVRVDTACNTVTDGGVTDVTYDRFFLPSLEQMYGVPQDAGVEGSYWPYWKNATGLESPSNGSSSDTNDARIIPSYQTGPNGAAVAARLRSVNRSTSDYVWYVFITGYIATNTAYNATHSQPACVIY